MLPLFCIERDCVCDVCKCLRKLSIELDKVIPCLLLNPLLSRWLQRHSFFLSHGNTTSEEECPFVWVDFSICHLQFHGHLERKHEFVLLEKRPACMDVNIALVSFADLEHSIATLASLVLGFFN